MFWLTVKNYKLSLDPEVELTKKNTYNEGSQVPLSVKLLMG